LVEDFRRRSRETAVVAHRGNRRYRTTYGELADLAGRFSAELNARNIPAGERVVLWGANSAEWIAAFFGCLLRGVIAVPLDAAGSPEFVERIVKDVRPRLIVTDRHLLHSLTPGAEALSVPNHLFADLPKALPTQTDFSVSEAVKRDAPFQIVFTSGTTSEPKGIVHTHANVLASEQPIENEMAKYMRYERWVHPLRFLHTLPLSHVFGQFMGLWLPPLLGGELHFAEQLEARRMVDLIKRDRISVLVAVPRVLLLLRTHLIGRFPWLPEELAVVEKPSLARQWWRFRKVHSALGWKFWSVISGGAALPPELESFWNRIGIALIQGYGMTETTALVTLNHPFKIAEGTIGKPLPGREVRLSADGEIMVRGDMLATATWQEGKMRPRTEEWLATGDLGETSEHGELRFLGRKGDVIVTAAGMNVHPADLEQAMLKQPDIRECAVVPCETATGIEPVAVVITSGNEAALQKAVLQANHELAEFQHIRHVLKWPEPQFPHTSTGKLLRRKIAQWANDQLVSRRRPQSATNGSDHTAHPAQSTRDILLQVIEETTGEQVPSADDNLRLTEDLHLDSLGRVQLQSELEQRLGIELEDDALATAQTLGELRAILDQETAASGPNLNIAPAAATVSLPKPGPAGVGAATTQLAINPEPAVQPKAARDKDSYSAEHFYTRWPWSWLFQTIRVVYQELIAQPMMWLLVDPKVRRATADLPQGPVLIIANHVTSYDATLMLYALPGRLRRHMAIAMSGEMLRDYRRGENQSNWFMNLFVMPQYWLVTALYNVFPLPRLHGFRKSFSHAGDAMDQGYSVMVFPEGAKNRDEYMHEFRSGIGLLAQESNVPVVPMALIGLEKLGGLRWIRSGKIEVRVGNAIQLPENVDEMDPAVLTRIFEDAVRELLEPGMRVIPAAQSIGAAKPAVPPTAASYIKPTRAAD
jgi:long-chain acyl-CoA synthetase